MLAQKHHDGETRLGLRSVNGATDSDCSFGVNAKEGLHNAYFTLEIDSSCVTVNLFK